MLKNKIFDEIYEKGDDGIPEFKFFMNGEWKYGESLKDIHSPIDQELIARVSEPTEQQTKKVLKKSYNEGRNAIRDLPGEERIDSFLKASKMLKEHKNEIINVAIKDAGKPYSNANGEVEATIERLKKTTMEMRRFLGDYIPGDWSEETLESEAIVKKEPYGLILAISPFNYPLFISATKIIPALLSGNAIILKPPMKDPITPLILTRILEKSGIPKHSFSTLTLKGSNSDLLIKDKRINSITFTGSTPVGRKIIKKAGIKEFHMELGGKDPAIVLEDSDLQKAAKKITKGITSFSGQRCDGIRFILAVKPIHNQLKNNLKEEIKDIESKNPLKNKEAIMGPLIDIENAKHMEEAYKDAINKGANSLNKFERQENYVKPTILEVNKNKLSNLKAWKDEVFGPLALLIKVENTEEAIGIANSTPFGLDAAIFGKKEAETRKVARKLEVGAVFINEYPRHGIGYYPFGGMKCSGIGREGIGYSINQLTTIKSIVHNYKGHGVWEYI